MGAAMTPRLLAALAILKTMPGYKPTLLDPNFPKQAQFIEDPAKLKALFCTRRAAKSYTGGLGLVEAATENEGVNCLYLGLTRASAKGIIWKDVLKDINKRHTLDMAFNGTELTATTKNGSVIHVTGVDADEDEMEKLLGKKYKRIVIDEAASYTINLRKLIYGVLKPTTIDQGGDVWLMGTSGDLTQGLFFDITTGMEPGWKLFEWTANDNPYIAKQWAEELADIAQNRPLFMQTPLFKQWYLNQWVIDTEKLVYRFDAAKNSYQALPAHRFKWSYVLGVDLGYSPDPSAFVLCAFNDHDSTLYLVDTFKRTEMDITDVAEKIKWYQKHYDIFKVVIDGSNKQAVEEIQKRHGIALTAADKIGKTDFIQIMNAEFIQEKIKLGPNCIGLVEEYGKLIWVTEGDKIAFPRKENPNCQNHLTDAALYAWRFCYQFLSAPAKVPVVMSNREQFIAHTQVLMEERLEQQIRDQQSEENNQDIFAMQNMGMDENPLSYFLAKKRSG